MKEQLKYKWKKILRVSLWSLTAVSLFVLLLSAMKRNEQLKCKGLEIAIDGYNHELFISDAEVKKMLVTELGREIRGTTCAKLDLRKLERSLRRNPWISKVQIFIDNQQALHVAIAERMPVARIFTRNGQSFYIDSSCVVLPLSENEVADVPVFTNVPDKPLARATQVSKSNKRLVSDSLIWQEISEMGKYIKKDSFLLQQVGQVEITPKSEYVIYPAIGNHWVEFGPGLHYAVKLERLATFYKKIFGKVGLNKYEIIDLRYDKQVVATLRGKPEGRVDSAAAMRTFEALVNKTIREANDTSMKPLVARSEHLKPEYVTPQTLEPADQQPAIARPAAERLPVPARTVLLAAPKPAVVSARSTLVKSSNPATLRTIQKNNIQKNSKPKINASANSPQPKAVMPRKNDY